MSDDNEKVLSFRDQVLAEYHKIPFDPNTENKDLNEELADILIQNGLLRELLKTDQGKWGIEDYKDVAEVLSQFGILHWEFCKVMEAYVPEGWKDAIHQMECRPPDQSPRPQT